MRYLLSVLLVSLMPIAAYAQFDLGGAAEDAARKALEELTRKEEKKDTVAAEPSAASTQAAQGPATLHMFGKYDFIAGERILMADDFSNTTVGDFPKSWKTNGSGEIVTTSLSPGHWLMMKSTAVYLPPWHGTLPENFTFECDMVNANLTGAEGYVSLNFFERGQKELMDFNTPGNSGVMFSLGPPSIQVQNWKNKEDAGIQNLVQCSVFGDLNRPIHVAVSRQGARIRLWMNEVKVYDLPSVVPDSISLNAIQITSGIPENVQVIFTNVRLAEGAPDTRNGLMTDGRLSTTGITFDVGSDVIKPSSYGVLRTIAGVLTDNPGVRVRIIGHTDNDGTPDANLDLSKRRAAAVRTAFTTEFGIGAARMDVDGKGASEPLGPNTTSEGKAGNRRVEFVKL